MTSPQEKGQDPTIILKTLLVITRLSNKAFRSKTKEELIFVILNDSIQVIRYDRALLWDLSNPKSPKILGASGQAKFNPTTHMSNKWRTLFQNIKEIDKPQILESEVFSLEQQKGAKDEQAPIATVIWFPIQISGKLAYGLWLENWHGQATMTQVTKETLNLTIDHLIPAYAASLEKFTSAFSKLKFSSLSRQKLSVALLTLFFIMTLIRVPLRIVAPCEVVAKDPIVVTAPLEGIIEEIIVKPGATVAKGELLFKYDKRVPLQELKVAEKNLEITEADVNRSSIVGLENADALKELGTLKLKMEKAEVERDLAKFQASRLDVLAPGSGIVMIQNRDEWRGKPVKVGERVLSINNHSNTKVEIRLPEDDNVTFNLNEPIKVFLNINPETSHLAHITYISDYSSLSENQLPSFIAEAEWEKAPDNVKIGLKGTAILYGENVSLFYFILRKPWAIFRNFVGI
jgi:multidrug resistance efflux pump